MRLLVPLVPVASCVLLALPAPGAAAGMRRATLDGTEVPPISSTLGTFVGIARGSLRATWRVQVAHQPLAAGPAVAVTGGSYAFLTVGGHRLTGRVTGGTVAVTDRGSGCTDQSYRVTLSLTAGSFDGTLTHHRRSLLGRCVLYAATIHGETALTGS